MNKGWLGYFRYANMQNKLKELDVWIRCRLRYCIWKHCKGRSVKEMSCGHL